MADHLKVHMGTTSSIENMDITKVDKPSFITNMESLLDNKKSNLAMKKVNTKVPRVVLKFFKMYCVRQGEFRKTIFNLMLKQFLEKQKVLPFSLIINIHNQEINFNDVEEANFEFEEVLFRQVQEFKIQNRVTLAEIYTQVIIQFLEANREQ
ncbi:hypothetical protein [Psychrobacillus sp. FSL H8-0487]|uniref:hypothetical protein n=1 Tax=Psychrobacillus sp. FSL H8-0487 TaxID=2921391 RepID=UPI0030FA3683